MAKPRRQKRSQSPPTSATPPIAPSPHPLQLPPLQPNPPAQPMPRPLLVASLGNPAPYKNSLHSAGHILLSALALHLSYPPFTKSRPHANGLLSRPADSPLNPNTNITLWQSPTLMNVSGPAVATAWRTFLRDIQTTQGAPAKEEARLVVVHDELESGLGEVKVKKGGSAKGHNGLKSCIGTLGEKGFWRVGVGIGRPESREGGVVSAYVLREIRGSDRRSVEGCVGDVEGVLRRLGEE